MSVSKELVKAIDEVNRRKTQPLDTEAVVSRVDGKTAWVRYPDALADTPVTMTIDAKKGDVVQIRSADGRAWIVGNHTAPPTDDAAAKDAKRSALNAFKQAKKATDAAAKAQEDVEDLGDDVEELSDDVDELSDKVDNLDEVDYVAIEYCLSNSNSTFQKYGDWSESLPTFVSGKYYWTRTATHYTSGAVEYGTPKFDQTSQIAAETEIALNSTNNHFWYDNTGAYVTQQDNSYATGYATRITNAGILQSYNNKLMSSWTNSGVTFYSSDGSTPMVTYGSSGASIYVGGTEVANFGTSARLGDASSFNTLLESDGFYIREGSTKIMTLYSYTYDNRYLGRIGVRYNQSAFIRSEMDYACSSTSSYLSIAARHTSYGWAGIELNANSNEVGIDMYGQVEFHNGVSGISASDVGALPKTEQFSSSKSAGGTSDYGNTSGYYFTVPYLTVNKYGIVTSIGDRKIYVTSDGKINR